MLKNILPIIILLFTITLTAQANNTIVESQLKDTIILKDPKIDTTFQKKNFIQKVIAYFDDSNKTKEEKAFDVSFIGGPHYSSDSKLGLGLVASGLYRVDKEDKKISPSNVSLYGDITTTGFYVVGISSNTIFPQEKFRIDLTTFFASQPSRYWGVGYDKGRNKEYTEYTGKEFSVRLDLLARIFPKTYIGIIGDFTNRNGGKFENMNYLEGEKRISSYGGVGLGLSYDSRDFIPNPYKGIYANLKYTIYPKLIGNRNTISKTEAIFRAYQKVWDGGLLAFDVQGVFMGGNVPWNMMVLTGSSRMMRGYYEGRYRDRMFMGAQVELRQHVWRRSGIVVWGGAGNIFHDFNNFKMKQTLPTFGLGYRWEFKNRVNIRLDYGVGKGETAFYFNINEAF